MRGAGIPREQGAQSPGWEGFRLLTRFAEHPQRPSPGSGSGSGHLPPKVSSPEIQITPDTKLLLPKPPEFLSFNYLACSLLGKKKKNLAHKVTSVLCLKQ